MLKKVIKTKEDKIKEKEKDRLYKLEMEKRKICPQCESEDTAFIESSIRPIYFTPVISIREEIYECNSCECDYSVEYQVYNQ